MATTGLIPRRKPGFEGRSPGWVLNGQPPNDQNRAPEETGSSYTENLQQRIVQAAIRGYGGATVDRGGACEISQLAAGFLDDHPGGGDVPGGLAHHHDRV